MDNQRKGIKRYEIETNIKKESEGPVEPIYWMLYVVKWSSFRFLILPVITLFMIIVRALIALGTFSGEELTFSFLILSNLQEAVVTKNMVILKHRDIGWRLPYIYRLKNGISTMQNGGGWITLP